MDLRLLAPWLRTVAAEATMRWSPQTRRRLAYALGRLLLVALDRDQTRDLLVAIYQTRGGSAIAAATRHYTDVVSDAAQAAAEDECGGVEEETDDGDIVRRRHPSPIDVLTRLGIDVRQIVVDLQAGRRRSWSMAELATAAALVDRDRWIVDQLVPRAEVSVVGGAPKTGKSWFALYLVICVAAGVSVFGQYAVLQGPVLVIAEDDGVAEINHRLAAIARGLGIDRYALPIRVVVRQHVRIDEPSTFAWLQEEITSCSARLVLIDSLSRTHGAEESSRSEMAPILDSLLYLADRIRIGLMIVHHARKSGTDGGSASTALRGTSDLAAVARSILLVGRDGDSMTIDVDANYADVPRIIVTPTIPTLGDADPIATFTVDRDDRAEARQRATPKGDLRSQIVGVIQKYGPKPRTYVVKAVKGRDNDIYTAIAAMVAAGTLVEVSTVVANKNGTGTFTRRDLALPGSAAAGSGAAGSGSPIHLSAAAPAAAGSLYLDLSTGSGSDATPPVPTTPTTVVSTRERICCSCGGGILVGDPVYVDVEAGVAECVDCAGPEATP